MESSDVCIIMEYYYEDVSFSPFLLVLVHTLLVSCSRTGTPGFTIAREDSLRYEGKTVELFRMTNRNGMTVKVTNYGASLTFVSAPDKEGVLLR